MPYINPATDLIAGPLKGPFPAQRLFVLTNTTDGYDGDITEILGIYSTVELAQLAANAHSGNDKRDWNQGREEWTKHILYSSNIDDGYEIEAWLLDTMPS